MAIVLIPFQVLILFIFHDAIYCPGKHFVRSGAYRYLLFGVNSFYGAFAPWRVGLGNY